MGEQIANWIAEIFEGDAGKIIAILIISMLPIVELRGAIPVAAVVFGRREVWERIAASPASLWVLLVLPVFGWFVFGFGGLKDE